MIGRHRLSREEFAALARGLGGAQAVRGLGRARLSRHLLLLKFIADAWPPAVDGRDEALAVLSRAQARAPAAVAAVLGDPLVGAWAAQAASRLQGWDKIPTPLPVDLGHLGAVAAAAAMRTGTDADLTVYVHDGTLVIPGIGSARLPLPQLAPVRLTVQGGRLTAGSDGARIDVPADPSTDAPPWRGLRRLTATVDSTSIDVALEDANPYRDGHHIPAAERLSARDLARWAELFTGAWELLARCAPARAGELAAGLRSIVPLADEGMGRARSATIRDAFGSFGLTLPASPAAFAVTMVHEFQHSKLSAVLDLVALYDTADRTAYYAPWRPDPRPIGGLLQGAYAFLGVADMLRSLRRAPGLGEPAGRELAGVREQVRHAIDALDSSGRLTASGQRFVAGMRSTLHSLMGEQLPAGFVQRAREALADHHAAWRQRYGAGGPVRLSMS